MNVKNVLIVSPMFRDIKALVEKEDLHKNFRYLSEIDMTQDDLTWADALVSFNLNSSYDYSHLKWVHSLGAGVDRILFKKEWNKDVLLTRTICSFGQRIAEYCLSYILSDLQLHQQFQELKQQTKWQPITPRLLNELKVLIYGTGEIGQTVAKVFSSLGIQVYGVSLSGNGKDYFNEVMTIDSHFSRLQEMDVLINTLPLTERTANLFDESIFKHVSNVGFINVGRGASLDEAALLHALKQRHVRFAVLDVFTYEPLPEENLLWNHPQVHITPHISAVTTPKEGVICFIETLRNIEENKPLRNMVDIKKGY